MFTGDPVRFGFPKPDYKIYESHPIVNSLVLHHLGHGDLPGAAGRRAPRRRAASCSSTGRAATYDVIVLATGYHLHYPFLDPALLRWAGHGSAPDLYLNVFTQARPEPLRARHDRGLRHRLAGALRAGRAGGGVPPRADDRARPRRAALEERVAGPRPDLSGGYHYLGLERMSYYVNKDAYRSAVRAEIERLGLMP